MPSDIDREITDDSLGEEIKVSVPADLVKALKGLAIACGTTLFVTVLGAWKVCALDCHLCRYRDFPCQRLIPEHEWCLERVHEASQSALSVVCKFAVDLSGDALSATLFACVQLLLSQYSGLKDVIVQTAMAGRVASELEPLIGWFANGAAVRTKLDGGRAGPCIPS